MSAESPNDNSEVEQLRKLLDIGTAQSKARFRETQNRLDYAIIALPSELPWAREIGYSVLEFKCAVSALLKDSLTTWDEWIQDAVARHLREQLDAIQNNDPANPKEVARAVVGSGRPYAYEVMAPIEERLTNPKGEMR